MCRKCHERIETAGTICRACGGILEEIAESKLFSEAERVVHAEMPSVPDPAATKSSADAAKPPIVMGPGSENDEPQLSGPDWKCHYCGVVVPGNFDVCWNCLTTKEGEPAPNAARLLSEVDAYGRESEPDALPPEAELLDESDQEVATRTECPNCGSTKLIRDVTLAAQSGDAAGTLEAVVFGHPRALFFKNRESSEIRADICGTCGHTQLRVVDPGRLYEHYRDSLARNQPGDSMVPAASRCKSCGMLVARASSTCPHCGQSQADW